MHVLRSSRRVGVFHAHPPFQHSPSSSPRLPLAAPRLSPRAAGINTDWEGALCDAAQACLQRHAEPCSPQALSNLVWAMATLRLALPRGLHAALLQRAQAAMGEFSAQGMANLMWGLARMRAPLPGQWLDCFAEVRGGEGGGGRWCGRGAGRRGMSALGRGAHAQRAQGRAGLPVPGLHHAPLPWLTLLPHCCPAPPCASPRAGHPPQAALLQPRGALDPHLLHGSHAPATGPKAHRPRAHRPKPPRPSPLPPAQHHRPTHPAPPRPKRAPWGQQHCPRGARGSRQQRSARAPCRKPAPARPRAPGGAQPRAPGGLGPGGPARAGARHAGLQRAHHRQRVAQLWPAGAGAAAGATGGEGRARQCCHL